MAVSKKISELPVLIPADAADLIAIVDVTDGVTKQSTVGSTAVYNQGDTGAVDRTQVSHNQEFVYATDFMTTAQIADVRARTLGEDVLLPLQAALDTGKIVVLPSGSCLVSSKIMSSIDRGGLIGQGPHQSEIVGNFLDGDIFHIDGSVATVQNFVMHNFKIDSTVAKTSGAGFHLEGNSRCSMRGIIAGGQDGRGSGENLFTGIHFDGFDATRLNDFEAFANANSIICNGGIGGGGLYLSQGKISGGGIGIHVAGDVGGLYVDSTDINNNDTAGVTFDQSEVAIGNRQSFFGPGVSIDGENIMGVRQQPGVVFNDPDLQDVFFTGTWINVNTFGIDIQQASATETRIQINGGRIGNTDDDGIRIQACPRLLQINGVDFLNSTGFAINATVDCGGLGDGEGVLIGPTNRFRNNTAGDVTWATIPPLPGTSFSATVADDAVFSFTPRDLTTAGSSGLMMITQGTGQNRLLCFYTAKPASSTVVSINSLNFDVTTGVLTGTTGVDTNQTVSAHTDKKVYIENRLGAVTTYRIHLLGAHPGAGGTAN